VTALPALNVVEFAQSLFNSQAHAFHVAIVSING